MTSVQPKKSRLTALYKYLERYSLDVRSLALLRIGLALVLLSDLFTRFGDLTAHYTDAGVVPRAVLNEHLLRAGYWTIHGISGHPIIQGFIFLIAALCAVAMLFGYHSRLATIASWVFLISLHNRNPLLIFAADDVLRAVMFWAMFLPLGAAYSVDRAMNTATRPVPLRILSGATLAIMAQQCFIYIFSAVFKTTSATWWPDGTAVYYALSYDQYVTALGHFLLNLGPLLTIFTFVTLVLEWIGPLLIWSPVRNDTCRMVAVVLFISLHVGFGLTLNLGIFPFLSIVTWLAFIPTSAWEALSNKVYNTGEVSPARRGLRIFYDADCGFCKKVVHLIRMLLALPHTPLATAQSIPEINQAMETHNSWVIVDWQGKHHYKFEGIAYVVGLSPVFRFLAPVLRWKPVMAIGTSFYEWVANNRKFAGRFTRPFKFQPLTVKTPSWVTAVALFLLALTFMWNLRSVVSIRTFKDSPQPAVKIIQRVVTSRTAQRFDWIGRITRLDQSWSIFVGPPRDDGWHVITGTPLAAQTDQEKLNVFQPGQAIDFEKPSLGDRARFYKNMQWRTLYINLNRHIGSKIMADYGRYLCAQSAKQGHPLKDIAVYFMEESTAPPGEPQTVEKTVVLEKTCQNKQ